MFWYVKLAVLLATPTAICGGKTYYPVGCDKSSVGGTDCVLTCKGQDACNNQVNVPSWSTLKNFVVRCVGAKGCNSLQLGKTRNGVNNYLICIQYESCNSAESARDKSSFLYCEGKKDTCEKYKNKRVQKTAIKNGVPVVIFNNGIAVGRSPSATGADAGIISDPNGLFLPHHHVHWNTHFLRPFCC